jgi:KDO2-lipid IV(A) lauroyltransferase
MGAIGFYIFYILNSIFTLLPLRILYLFSDLLFLALFYFPSYRRKTVTQNLKNAFPDKSGDEIRIIEKKYYRHLADIFIETLKLSNMRMNQIAKRMKLTNPETMKRLFDEDRDVLAVLGHYNNWEWLQSINYYTDYLIVSIYKPLQDKRFDRFMRHIRGKWGMILTPMSSIVREIVRLRNSGTRTIYSFITDQTPAKKDIRYWTRFLNQDTAVYTGVEKVALRYDMAVVFFNVQKVKRGYYEVTTEVLFEHTAGLPENVITEGHIRKLEEVIKEKPEYWIWSHRRWKHKRPDIKP